MIIACQNCGLEFKTRLSLVKRGNKYCSRKCQGEWKTETQAMTPERFWRLVTKTETCWLWKRCRVGKGQYGVFRSHGKDTKAHRYSYEITFGPIPEGLSVLHRCDNPPCVNPSHLFLGTTLDNMQDCASKGRRPKGEGTWNSKLTEKDVINMRILYKGGWSAKRLATLYGVVPSVAGDAARGKTWKYISQHMGEM
jgi:hypothetical protein